MYFSGSAKSTGPNNPSDSFISKTNDASQHDSQVSTETDEINESKRAISNTALGVHDVDERQVIHNDGGNTEAKPKRYGSVLAGGFSWKKRDSGYSGDGMNEEQVINRLFEDRYGLGDDFHKRSKREAHGKRFIRYFGRLLGRGYIKRDGPVFDESIEESPEIYVPGELVYVNMDPDMDIAAQNEFDSAETPSDSEEEASEILTDEGDRADDSKAHDKRYFNSDLGGRFVFRKRSGLDKRYGFTLGRGFSYGIFGKRSQDKRYFGHVLGGGYRLGKRTPEIDTDNVVVVPESADRFETDNDKMGWLMGRGLRTDKRGNKRYGYIFGHGYHLGKRMDESGDSPFDETYFVDDDGNIELLQKRFVLTQGYKLSSPHPKRYGFVLNRGFSLGKKNLADTAVHADDDDNGDDLNGDQMKMDKRYGFLLGRGFAFKKRTPATRTYGTILGNGFSFGKRDDSGTKE